MVTLTTLVGRWSEHSQLVARRNAMAACTALAARRIERIEVQDFLAAQLRMQLPTQLPTQIRMPETEPQRAAVI